MNLVFVDQEKNTRDVVVLYKKMIKEIKISKTDIPDITKNFLDLSI